MKTFRFFATLLVIALCAGFTSCSDDDDENPLVGTWVNIENRNSMEYKEVMTINENGTGSSANYTNGQLDKDGVENFRDMKFLCIVLKIAFGVEKGLIKLI